MTVYCSRCGCYHMPGACMATPMTYIGTPLNQPLLTAAQVRQIVREEIEKALAVRARMERAEA